MNILINWIFAKFFVTNYIIFPHLPNKKNKTQWDQMTISINPQVDEEESSRTGLTLSSSRALDSNYFSSASPACILTASVLSNSLRLYGL